MPRNVAISCSFFVDCEQTRLQAESHEASQLQLEAGGEAAGMCSSLASAGWTAQLELPPDASPPVAPPTQQRLALALWLDGCQ